MTKLCHHTEISFGLECIKHLYDVFMPQIPQDLNLLPQVPDVFFAFAMLHYELHGSDLTGKLSATFIHLQTTKACNGRLTGHKRLARAASTEMSASSRQGLATQSPCQRTPLQPDQ